MFNFKRLCNSLFFLMIFYFSASCLASNNTNMNLYKKIQGAWETSINGKTQLIKFSSNLVEITLNNSGVTSKLRGTYNLN